MPRITIITPTYNRDKYIKFTIESILNQSFNDYEYYIIDDGSTDNTKKVVEPYLSDSRIKYLYHENIGEAETVNIGWTLACGKYFTQINSDDTVYPNFLMEMIAALDKNEDYILAYPDFDFINANGNVIKTTRGRAWNFLRNLSEFSCEAACPGTVFRRSAFENIKQLKRKGYEHINDVEMYWNIALRGNFLHVPHVLATWRQHSEHISSKRYKCIPECEDWFNKYFSQPNLPDEVIKIKQKTRKSLCRYFISLIDQSDLQAKKKRILKQPYLDELNANKFFFKVIQVSDQDIIGNKFNGHDLHFHLRYNDIDALQYVCKKSSKDPNTFIVDDKNSENFFQSLVYNKQFAEADLLHFHLLNNTSFNINFLQFLASIKPIVWTIHDPWSCGGHCIYPGSCQKLFSHCRDCQNLHVHFARINDYTALEYAQKKFAIRQSQIFPIVASKFMQGILEKSPIWKDKRINLVPFGVNQDLFKPKPLDKMRREIGLPANATILFARTQRYFKGLAILRKALMVQKRNFILLTVGENGLLPNLPSNIMHKEYGWITDDAFLAKLYQSCDLFLMPSEQEAFGMMAIEAMSCGKMVVALDVPNSALPEVIDSPECGIAVKPSEYPATLASLLENPEEIQVRGEKSLNFARREYALDIYLKRIIKVYEEAMKEFVPSEDAKLLLSQIVKYAPEYPYIPDELIHYPAQLPLPVYIKAYNYYKKYGLIKFCSKVMNKIINNH